MWVRFGYGQFDRESTTNLVKLGLMNAEGTIPDSVREEILSVGGHG